MRELQATMINTILLGDCREILKGIATQSINMVYLDPPFFTQKSISLLIHLAIKYTLLTINTNRWMNT